MSPYTAIMRRSGNCFELAHVLVSWLAGAGYEAFVAHGYARRDTCLGVTYRKPCPHVPDETPVVEKEMAPKEEPRYKLTPLPDMRSKYVLYIEERQRQDRQKILNEIESKKQAKIAELERPPPDEVDGWRTHAWVLVLPGRKGIKEPFFIEPSEGIRYPLSASQYQRLHAIYNHENYYANLQDCSHGLDQINYDLCNLKRWEHMLPGEPFSRRQMAGVDYADRATAVDTEKHLDMPASWVEKLELTADEYEQRYPGCYKIINYKKVTHEKFSPYLQQDGIVDRITIYKDYAFTKPLMMYEQYKHRADKMEYVKTDYRKSEIVETFAIGRSDQMKKHVYDSELAPFSIEGDRVIDFYYTGRIDRLAKIECGALTFNEYFVGRDDRLESRLTVYTEIPKKKRELQLVTETYGRNPEVPIERDIYKRVFNLTENTIELMYHYHYNCVTNDRRLYKKPNLAETGGRVVFDPSKVSGYLKWNPFKKGIKWSSACLNHSFTSLQEGNILKRPCPGANCPGTQQAYFSLQEASPLGEEPRKLEMFLTLCEHLELENATRKAIRDSETDLGDYLRKRHSQLREPTIEVALFDTERNEAAKKGWKEQETLKAAVEERETEAEIDPLAPYLARMFGSGRGPETPLSYKEACLLREQCICDFRAKQLARQQLVQERYDKLNEEYKQKRLWYLANQYVLTPKKEAEYFATSAELAFQVHTLEVRLTRHRDLTGPRLRAMINILDKHPLLKEFHCGRQYHASTTK